jgi:hypothetical protein
MTIEEQTMAIYTQLDAEFQDYIVETGVAKYASSEKITCWIRLTPAPDIKTCECCSQVIKHSEPEHFFSAPTMQEAIQQADRYVIDLEQTKQECKLQQEVEAHAYGE